LEMRRRRRSLNTLRDLTVRVRRFSNEDWDGR
jgi:hypothetical protein